MRHEIIVLPKAAHSRIAEVIQSGGIQVELYEDKSIRRHRHDGDSLYPPDSPKRCRRFALPPQSMTILFHSSPHPT